MTVKKADRAATAGEAPDFRTLGALATSDLPQLVRDLRRYREEKDKAEQLAKAITESVASLLERARIKTVRCGRLRVTRVDSRGPGRLDKMRLIEAGVSADLIAKATVAGSPYTTVILTEIED